MSVMMNASQEKYQQKYHAALLEDSPCQPLVLQASLQLGGHGWKLFDLGLVEHVGLFLESLFAFLSLLSLLPLLLLLLADLLLKLFAGCLLLYLHTHTHTQHHLRG